MSIMVNAPSKSIAAEAGIDTEYGFMTTSEKFEKTCASQGKALKRKYAIGKASKQLTALEIQNSDSFIPMLFM